MKPKTICLSFNQKIKKISGSRFQIPGFRDSGFTFIEVIVAIFIMSIGVVGTLIAVQAAISSTSQSCSRLTAANLAQEGIEIVRSIRDTNWLEQRTATTTPWDENVGAGDWEADYTDTNIENPSLDLCVFPCVYNNLHFLKKIDGGFYNYSSGNDTQFKRKITITPEHASPDPDPSQYEILKISVTVYWGGGGHSILAQEELYNWHSQ